MQIGQKFRVSHSSSTRSPVRNFLFNNAFQSSSKIDHPDSNTRSFNQKVPLYGGKFKWKRDLDSVFGQLRANSTLSTARWQSVREVSLPLSIPPSSFVCHASATFPAAYFFPIGCATGEEGGGEALLDKQG